MHHEWTKRAVLLSGLVLTGSYRAPAQQSPQHPVDTRPEGQPTQNCTYSATRSDGKTSGNSNCDAGTPSAAKRFPYPGENPYSLPKSDAAPADSTGAANTQQSPSAAKRFPYPGEPSAPEQTSPLKDSGSSGESSSSSSSSSAGDLPPDAGDTGALPAPKRARKPLPPVPRQTPDEREEEDLKVAAFYQNDGNYRAAYMRAKDAVGITESDPEAQFALAEAARKLGKLDEAQKGYRRCLDLDPIPKLRKASEKALKEMAGS